MNISCLQVCLVVLISLWECRTISGMENQESLAVQSSDKEAEIVRHKRHITPEIADDMEEEMEPLIVDGDRPYMYPQKRPFRFLRGQPKRQPWGLILGGGYKLGKRIFGQSNRGHMLLGGGFKMGKRQDNSISQEYIDMLDSDTNGYDFEESPFRSGRDKSSERYPHEDLPQKRGLGSVLGGGYKFGKSFGGILKGYRLMKRQPSNPDGEDLDGFEKSLFGYRLKASHIPSDSNYLLIRNGLRLGKRVDEETYMRDTVDSTESEVAKRLFGHVLWGGYKLGKRATSNNILEALKAWTGKPVRTYVPQNEVQYRINMLRPAKYF